MRILHLLASPYWSGPMENVALLAEAQRELGHDVSIAIDRHRADAPAEEVALPHLQARGLLDDGLSLSVKASTWDQWKASRQLAKRRLDVVHTHFTHDHYVAWLGRPRNAGIIRSIHAPRSLRWTLPRADAYTVPAETFVRRLLGRRVGVMPPLVDPRFRPAVSKAEHRQILGVQGSPLIGMVSTFQSSRRHDVGVEAFALLRKTQPAARLVLTGDGQREHAIRAHVDSLGLSDAVTFAGYQRGAAFIRWLQALDVVWILGLGNDWSGRAAAQARACGVRVVGVDEGGLSNLADEIVPLIPEAILEATTTGSAVEKALPSNEEIARRVLALYG